MPIVPFAGPSTAKGALVPIGSAIVTNTSTSSIIFSNVPQIYQDLYMVVAAANNSYLDGYGIYVNLNGDGSSIYSITALGGNSSVAGTSTSAFRASNQGGAQMGVTNSNSVNEQMAYMDLHILNYRTTTFKTMLSVCNANRFATGNIYYTVGLYRSTSPVTTVQFNIPGVNLRPTTTATLFGVRSVNQ